MRKIIALIGTMLIATILISGSAVAALYYIMYVDYSVDCTNINEILGGEDNTYATIGVNSGGTGTFGCAVLNLSDANPMPPSTSFTVYGWTGVGNLEEEYSINVSQYPNDAIGVYLGNGDDSSNEVFTTPSLQGSAWQFIIIRGLSGEKDLIDSIWGPEIDAVGWG
jgi:hypothetical protein